MTRFAQAFATTVLPLLVLAAVVAALVGGDAGPLADDARSSSLPQAEDGAEASETPEVVTPIAGSPALVGVARLLEALTVTGEPSTATGDQQRIFLTRDPFNPVVVESEGGGLGDGGLGGLDGDGDGGTDGGDGGTDGGDDGTDGGDGGTDGGDGGSNGGGQADACSGDENETICEGRVVTVNSVTDQQAEVVVDGTIFTVGVDDEFATSFRILALDPPCVTMLYGDEAFTLCTGVTVRK